MLLLRNQTYGGIMTFNRLTPAILAATFLMLNHSHAAATDDSVVAKIGNQSILSPELDAKSADTLFKQQATYDEQLKELQRGYARSRQAILEKQLNDLVDARVLALEAKARKSTPEALTAAVKPAEVTDAQMHDFYDANKAQVNQPYERIASQIKAFLQNQSALTAQRDYLESLRRKYKAVVLLAPLREEVAAVGPHRGPANAPVTIVEFSDFQCPFCGQLEPVLQQVIKKYPTQVQVVYRHMPLAQLHPDAEKAAEAAVCAQNQGKFWEMHDLMFAEQGSLSVDGLKEKARRLGIDAPAFDDCLDSGKSKEAVRLDGQASIDLGLNSTPILFIDGRYVSGTQSLEQLSAIIDDELHAAAGKTASR
jgi:protein-disulfide isomerase